jgi:Na+/H+ antiporter NhaD/arsenite permease-like protein
MAPFSPPHTLTILAVFIITYGFIALGRIPGLKLNRAGIALLGAIGMMVFGRITTAQAVSLVNWPTVFLLFGFLVLSAQLRISGFYDLAAQSFSTRMGHPSLFLLVLMTITAGLSAILNHDIVCLAFTPIVASALLKNRLNPVPFLVAMALASNIGAAATLIGNPQDMLIGETAHLGFGDYLLWCLPPVLAALGISYGIIWWLSRNQLLLNGPLPGPDRAPVRYPYNRPHTLKGLVILGITVGLFFTPIPKEITVLCAAGIHLASREFRSEDLLGLVEWEILILFMGLFTVTGAFQATGYGDDAVRYLARSGFDLNKTVNLILATAGLSNLVGNSATVMFLLKVLDMSKPTTAYLLALANSFGGSLLVIGSVANLIMVQQAHGMGVNVSFKDFARFGIPVTLASLAALWLWVAWVG